MSFLVFEIRRKIPFFVSVAYFVVSAIDALHQPKPNDTLTKTIQSTGLLNSNQRTPSKPDENKIKKLESLQSKP